MKFYDREIELSLLKRADSLKDKRSVLSLIIGRRRIGKTSLALKVNEKSHYFFISRKDEKLLCEEFVEELKKFRHRYFWTF
ncbi:hypothetical protein [Nitratiruptor tergarcus]|uniref:hypothetical protein n=1 Tax=Nitratiruptor tergarcus TaxID=269259 RepID=UPI000A047100|nr:hypothetical protein [Nitratiruptor tergarcus]